MAKNKRIAFSFDKISYKSLEKMKEDGRFGTLAETVRQSLMIDRALQMQNRQGYTEVCVRNPQTGESRIMNFLKS